MRPISDEVKQRIKTAREQEGLSLPALVAKFSLSKSTVYEVIKDCDSSKVKRASPTRKVVVPSAFKPRPPLSKADLGEAARQLILARLMFAGLTVFRPLTEDTPVDLLVLGEGETPLKCQCKYIYPTSQGSHQMPLKSVRKNNPTKKAYSHRYTAAEVDFFLGYCWDNDRVYIIPHRETRGRASLQLWVVREPKGSNNKPAFDYKTFEEAYHLLDPRIPSVS